MNSDSALRFKSLLIKDDLTAIQELSAESTDVRALLWEVTRLRALTLHTHEYFRQGSSSTAPAMGESLQDMVADKPITQEQSEL